MKRSNNAGLAEVILFPLAEADGGAGEPPRPPPPVPSGPKPSAVLANALHELALAAAHAESSVRELGDKLEVRAAHTFSEVVRVFEAFAVVKRAAEDFVMPLIGQGLQAMRYGFTVPPPSF